MANLRTAVDAAIGDLHISTPLALDGVCKAVPGDPIPLDGARASKALRIQQLALLRNGFPLGLFPSISSSPNHEELGCFALQSLLGQVAFDKWCAGAIGQFRPKKLISSIKAEIASADEWDLPLLKDAAVHFLDKSLYAIGLCAQIDLHPSSSLLLTTENHGEREKRYTKATLFQRLLNHDITVKASWPQLFLDHKAKYWEVPESFSLDCASPIAESGLQYCLGIHQNAGLPKSVDSSNNTEPPLTLFPGLCAKVAVSCEKSKDLWRRKETKEDVIIETETGQYWHPAYDVRLKEPHAAISGIIGATCVGWLGGGKGLLSVEPAQDTDKISSVTKNRVRFGADLFGSVSYTFQHGKFRELYNDLTRVDARLDITSANDLAKKVSSLIKNGQDNQSPNELSSPKLNIILQQQVVGPIIFRLDTKLSSWSGKQGPQVEDLIYSLNYSLRMLGSGKVVAWYSGKRKEGMIELRMFEF